jgi:hypothetical protein
MRYGLMALILISATPALGQEASLDAATAPGGVVVSTSYNISTPMSGTSPEQQDKEDQSYRTQLYAKAAAECADLLASVATACTITGITVSTQINRSPGMPDSMYASGTVTMQVDLKQP